ncbi:MULTISPECIES: hypothetical protein [Achromobacter]|uniref:hypothetical protein n=1 Tax=Achromobacter TaxID=222 RepID=UPI0023FA2F45|nr:hypothetical protein [Achromobacter anxifer]MDF8363358.1 hypothetical protein [Achromobacter anxifer]
MDRQEYERYWSALQPAAIELHTAIASHVRSATGMEPIGPPSLDQGDEFRLSQDWQILGDDNTVIGIDIVLADSEQHCCTEGRLAWPSGPTAGEPSPGLNVVLEIQTAQSGAVAGYIPANRTPDVFTLELDVLLERLQGIADDATEYAGIVIDSLNHHLAQREAADSGDNEQMSTFPFRVPLQSVGHYVSDAQLQKAIDEGLAAKFGQPTPRYGFTAKAGLAHAEAALFASNEHAEVAAAALNEQFLPLVSAPFAAAAPKALQGDPERTERPRPRG